MAISILKFILLLAFVSVFVPFSPKMPAPGLDPSWALGLNQAIAQGIAFGKDIIFTLGPYSAIYTKAYHPNTDLMIMSSSIYLAFSYWFCFTLLMKNVKWYWSVLFCLFVFTMIYGRDSLFFSYTLITGLVCYKMLIGEKHQCLSTAQKRILLAIIFMPLGLLALIKGSFLILSITTMLFCALFFAFNRKNDWVCISVISPLVALVLFWIAANQSLSHLASYLYNTVYLASEFSEAMATESDQSELRLYLLNAGLLLLAIICVKQTSLEGKSSKPLVSSRIFLFSIFFTFLFLSFKTGFTRQYGHIFIASTSLLTAALLIPFINYAKIVLLLLIFSFNTWFTINSHYTLISLKNNFKSQSTAAWFGLVNRINNSQSLKQDFELSLHFLHEQIAFPQLKGTTDIYSSNQSYLIASQNTWSPRPIFQSYSVFTAKLAEKNKLHLQGAQRPDNVIFKIEPLDNRIPALEDGASWPSLVLGYQPTQLFNDFLLLQKREAFFSPQKSISLLADEQHFLGEQVNLPINNQLLFAEIEIKPTFWGRLAILFFKPAQLQIDVELNDGIHKQYRLVANMAKSGFLISPLIENTAEFALLFDKVAQLDKKQVKSFQITCSQSRLKQWHSNYIVHLRQVR